MNINILTNRIWHTKNKLGRLFWQIKQIIKFNSMAVIL